MPANGTGHGPSRAADTGDALEAFVRLSRGDPSAETLGKLLDLDDRKFWKGARVGSVAVLAPTTLPAIRATLAGLPHRRAPPEAEPEDGP